MSTVQEASSPEPATGSPLPSHVPFLPIQSFLASTSSANMMMSLFVQLVTVVEPPVGVIVPLKVFVPVILATAPVLTQATL